MIYTINRCLQCGALYLYPTDGQCQCGGNIAPAIQVMGQTHAGFTPPAP